MYKSAGLYQQILTGPSFLEHQVAHFAFNFHKVVHIEANTTKMPGCINASQFPTFADCVSTSSCISPAPSKGFRRCGNAVNAYDRGTASRLRHNILSSVTTSHASLSDVELREYARLSCCVRWHRAQVIDEYVMTELVSRWRYELLGQFNPRTVATRSPTAVPIRSLHTDYVPRSLTTSRIREIEHHHEQALPARPRFVAFKAQDTNSMLDVLSLPLTDLDRREHLLYCASRTSDPGYHKIGCSPTNSLLRRIEKFQSCSGSRSTVRMNFSITTINAHRAKDLLYKELQQHRREEQDCQGPHRHKKHSEWFEKSLNEIKRTIGRWANWMQHAQPYDEQGRLRIPWARYCETLEREGTPITSESLYRAFVDGSIGDEDDDEDSSTQYSSSGDDSSEDDSEHGNAEEAHTAEEESEDNSCPVCLEEMTNPARTVCGHEFHAECIAQVLVRDNRCPMCRAELVDGVVVGAEVAEIPMQNTVNVI